MPRCTGVQCASEEEKEPVQHSVNDLTVARRVVGLGWVGLRTVFVAGPAILDTPRIDTVY